MNEMYYMHIKYTFTHFIVIYFPPPQDNIISQLWYVHLQILIFMWINICMNKYLYTQNIPWWHWAKSIHNTIISKYASTYVCAPSMCHKFMTAILLGIFIYVPHLMLFLFLNDISENTNNHLIKNARPNQLVSCFYCILD